MTAVDSTALPRALPSPRSPLVGRPDRAVVAASPAGTARGRALVRGLMLIGLALAFVVTCTRVGLPTDRVVLLGWVIADLAVFAVTDGVPGSAGSSPTGCRSPLCCSPTTPAVGWPTGWARPCTSRSRRRPTAGWPGPRPPDGRVAAALDGVLVGGARHPGLRQPFRRDAAGPRRPLGAEPPALGPVCRARRRPLGGRAGHLRALSGGAAVAGRQERRDRAGAAAVRRRLGEVLGLPRAGALLAESQGQETPAGRPCPRCTRPSRCSPACCSTPSRSGRGSGRAWSSTRC